MVSTLCCWDSASGVMLSLQLYPDKGRMTEARTDGPPRPLLYSLKCDMQKDLGNDGCDCEDEEGCQAIHGPSCKCKESSPDLSLFSKGDWQRWGLCPLCRWEQPANLAVGVTRAGLSMELSYGFALF